MLFSTKEAADYLGLSEAALKYHIYHGNIDYEHKGNSLIFTRQQLEQFKRERRKQGRPQKSHELKEK
jgi:predicted ArsR family transcriptional regulator